jgi:hypothetical protein
MKVIKIQAVRHKQAAIIFNQIDTKNNNLLSHGALPVAY